MKADPTLLKEIKAYTKTREGNLSLLGACDDFTNDLHREIVASMGQLSPKTIFSRLMLRYRRAVIACCLAATIAHRDGMSYGAQSWAQSVLEAWTPTEAQRVRGVIADGLHPSKLEEYAGSFIRATTV